MATKKTTAKTTAAETKTTAAAPVEEVKTEAKAPAKKSCATKKAAAKINVTLQYAEKEYSVDSIIEKIKAAEGETVISTLDVYVVPEKSTVYYVVNGEEKSIEL